MNDVDDLVKEADGYLAAGRLAEAERLCQVVLEVLPEHPGALMILGVVCEEQQRWLEAEALVIRGCALYPNSVGFHAALGRLRLARNRFGEAREPLETCVLLEPGEPAHRTALVAVYGSVLFVTFSERSKRAMSACLADDALNHSGMSKAWVSLLRLDPQSADLLRLFDVPDYDSFARQLGPDLLAAWQGNELLNSGLNRAVAADPAIERGLTFTRRWFFENRAIETGEAEPAWFPLLCALARICFFTEYVFTSDEDHPRLREDLSTAARVALLGCYEPLFAHDEAGRLSALSQESCYRDLMRVQVHEPREEREIEQTIPAWTPIEDPVSRAVRAQYEENPYPRWVTVGGSRAEIDGAGARGRDQTILVAGCGTGREAVEVARMFPDARVEAIDLSRASLAYAVRKGREMGTTNLSFGQADILQLRRLGRTFNLILASGVLHHMRDPVAGGRALLDRLRPGGILRLGLYSTIARAAVAEARAWIARDGFEPTPRGIRSFRAAVLSRDEGDPLRRQLTASNDFYTTSQCRDFLFHVQEHTFTLPEIADLVRRLGLSVLRVDTSSPALAATYHQRFPDDPAALSLTHWHAMEHDHPTLFAGMYSLWLCRTAEHA